MNKSLNNYNWKHQPQVKWKGYSRTEVIPCNARPLTNGSLNTLNTNVDANAFLPRPIKHWRKQLQPDNVRGGTIAKNIKEAFKPGGSVYLGGNVNEINNCCNDNLKNYLTSMITIEKYTPICNNSYTITAEDVANGWNGPIGKKICSDPVKNRIRSSTTLLSKKYYTDSKSYLKGRNKLFEQKSTTLPYPNVVYERNGQLLYPQDNPLGPQVYSTGQCQTGGCLNKQITIHKPNNKQYGVQGAVDSSTRIEKLKLDTVNKSGKSLNAVYGHSAANAGSYKLNGNSPYFIKNKVQTCMNFTRNGDSIKCN
jgi:hypothetical protein